jgi:hypothetical protein
VAAHRIRLDTAWEILATSSRPTDENKPHGKVRLPLDAAKIAGADSEIPHGLRRVFHSPSNLREGQRLELGLSGVHSGAAIFLNGEPVCRPDGTAEVRIDVSRRLQPCNEIRIAFSSRTHPEKMSLALRAAWLDIETLDQGEC